MTVTYAAHIVTSEAHALGDPEIIIMTLDEGTGAEPLLSYPLLDDGSVDAILTSNGWATVSEHQDTADFGYSIATVEPRDWDVILKTVRFSRDVADIEAARCETAWKILVRDAMNDPDTTKTTVAELAGISRERAYQIRDGRR